VVILLLVKNPVFHDRIKHIDTIFHYLWDCIANKEVEVKYVKTQDQVTNIFTKPLKYNVFIDERCFWNYEEIKFKEGVESKLNFSFEKYRNWSIG